jgi:hypothetical protein
MLSVKQTVEEIATRLHQLGVPDEIVARHVDRLRKLRRVKRKRLVRVLEDNRQRYRAVVAEPVDGI